MRITGRSISAALPYAVAAIFMLATATASVALGIEAEETVVVTPGAESVAVGLPRGVSVASTYGPMHGRLVPAPEGLVYEPAGSFSRAGSDLAIVHLTRAGMHPVSIALRLRFVAGETAWDGEVATQGDLEGAPPTWKNWTIDDPTGALAVEAGLLVEEAYVFDRFAVDGPTILVGLHDPAAGSGTTTSTTSLDVEVRDIPRLPTGAGSAMIFYRISDDQDLVAAVGAEWIDDAWHVRLHGADGPAATTGALADGRNRLRLRRWSGPQGSSAGTELAVNGVATATVASPPHLLGQAETHEILRTDIQGPGSKELVVENPQARRSGNLIDGTTRLIYDSFSEGPSTAWAVVGPEALSFSAQDLPGPGDRLDVDLGWLSSAQSSYLEKSWWPAYGGVADPPGIAIRLWVDPTAVTLQPGSSVRLAAACAQAEACEAARIGLGHDGSGLTIFATAWRAGGSAARIEAEVTRAAHSVEVRLRNGWLPGIANGSLELWIDGVLIGRETGIDNHSAQVRKLRLGLLTDADGSFGILGLDDYEAWRFDQRRGSGW